MFTPLAATKLKLIFLVALIVSHCAAFAAPDAQRILAASDVIRNPGRPFSVQVTLTEFRRGKQADASTLMTYARAQA